MRFKPPKPIGRKLKDPITYNLVIRSGGDRSRLSANACFLLDSLQRGGWVDMQQTQARLGFTEQQQVAAMDELIMHDFVELPSAEVQSLRFQLGR